MSVKSKGDNNVIVAGNDNSLYFQKRDIISVFDDKSLNEILSSLRDVYKDCSKPQNICELGKRDIEEKNKINRLNEDYFSYMCDEYMPYFSLIESFLTNPINRSSRDLYADICASINLHYHTQKMQLNSFEEFLTVTYKYYQESEFYTKENNLLCRIIINYMYWHCDIGDNVK